MNPAADTYNHLQPPLAAPLLHHYLAHATKHPRKCLKMPIKAFAICRDDYMLFYFLPFCISLLSSPS